MIFKRFPNLVILRVLLLALSILAFAYLWQHYDLVFTYILILLLICIQMAELIYFTGKINRELKKFLDALRYEDYGVSFNNKYLGGSFRELDERFSQIIEMMKTSRAEKHGQSELLQMALQNLKLGLIILDSAGTIHLMNTAACEMLGIPNFHSWGMLQRKKPGFADQLGDFKFEGRKLIELDTVSGKREFYLDLNHIFLLGKTYHLIAFSDLKNEIEQKEIDAWHKLIRILSHEVMNSVTPVASLSETIRDMLTDKEGKALAPEKLNAERIDDITLALETIIRRSRGMLNFVDDYRKLTKLPAPEPESFSIKSIFDEVCQLMKAEAREKGVELRAELQNHRLAIKADRKMIEQVLINLVSNAIYALEEAENGEIVLSADLQESRLVISVSDNGCGISEEILPSVFIPFFSTRKNGTGIGLSLSKNIMQLHRGSISVHSKEGKGTRFDLSFGI